MVSLNERLGVEYTELGFRLPTPAANGHGPFSCVNNSILKLCAPTNRGSKYGFMVEIKHIEQFDDAASYSSWIVKNSLDFDFVRIATTKDKIQESLQLARLLKDEGFFIFLNLMRSNEIDPGELEFLKKDLVDVDAVVFADSFGSLKPTEVRELISTAVSLFSDKKIGFHAHNNMGLAMANALTAQESGAQILDATYAGHGRGAGNLRMEEYWLERRLGVTDIALYELANHLERFEYSPGQSQSEHSFAYFLGAKLGWHPNDVMAVLDPNTGFSLAESVSQLFTNSNEMRRADSLNAYSAWENSTSSIPTSFSPRQKVILLGKSSDSDALENDMPYLLDTVDDDFLVVSLNIPNEMLWNYADRLDAVVVRGTNRAQELRDFCNKTQFTGVVIADFEPDLSSSSWPCFWKYLDTRDVLELAVDFFSDSPEFILANIGSGGDKSRMSTLSEITTQMLAKDKRVFSITPTLLDLPLVSLWR